MAHKNVRFLNARSIAGGNADTIVNLRLKLSTTLACHTNGDYVFTLSSTKCLYDVSRIAAGGDADSHIPCLAECLDLPCKDLIVGIVVSYGSKRRCVHSEGLRRQSWSVQVVPSHELRRNMLRVGRAAAVAK